MHCVQLSEVALESAGGGSEVGEAGDHRAATGSGYSNIDAIEMTAAGTDVTYNTRVYLQH